MLDEPSLGLAPLIVDQVMRTLAELHGGGMTLLLVEQNLRQALECRAVVEPRDRTAYLGI